MQEKLSNLSLLSIPSPRIGAKQQYYYDDDRLLQIQTDLHFKYVTELTNYSHQIFPLVGVGQVTTLLEIHSRIIFSIADYRICRRMSKRTLHTQIVSLCTLCEY